MKMKKNGSDMLSIGMQHLLKHLLQPCSQMSLNAVFTPQMANTRTQTDIHRYYNFLLNCPTCYNLELSLITLL